MYHPRNVIIPPGIRSLIPGKSSCWGPPRKADWASNYSKERNIKWDVVERGVMLTTESVYDINDEPVRFNEAPDWQPEAGVLFLHNAATHGIHGWTVTDDGYYIYDTNHWFFDPLKTPVFSFFKRGSIRKLKGPTLSLLSWCAGINLYHWMLEAIPRIDLFERSGLNMGSVDHILMPPNEMISVKRLMEHLNLPPEKMIFPDHFEQIECEYLIQTSHPGAPNHAPAYAVDFWRRRIPNIYSSKKRRIFVARGQIRRGLLNEDEVWLLLQRYGFEKFDHTEARDEYTAFQQAEIVIGAHGAGLSRIVFCQPSCLILEFVSRGWLMPFYCNLARSAGLKYDLLLGDICGGSKGIEASFSINIDVLKKYLDNLLG